jgi:ABC-type transporter Mla maintaining outer membrane lipid asymmetry permease subunit MlaE
MSRFVPDVQKTSVANRNPSQLLTMPVTQMDKVELSKSVVFGALVALAGCLRGMQCGRSASAVGAAATSAVVTGIVWIIASDGLFAVLTERLGL